MFDPTRYGGRPFHADVSVAAASAAGSVVLMPSAGQSLYLERLVVSTDTAQRLVVGVSDDPGRRLFAGYLAAGDTVGVVLGLLTEGTALAGGNLLLITAAISGADAQLDGWVLTRPLTAEG